MYELVNETENKTMWDVYAIDVRSGVVTRGKSVEKSIALQVVRHWNDADSVLFLWPTGVSLPSWMPVSS